MEQTPFTFAGFPAGKVQFCRLPAQFYTDLLPAIDDLGELKLTLYVLWFLDQLDGTLRYMLWNDFCNDQRFMQGLGSNPPQALADALGVALDNPDLLAGAAEKNLQLIRQRAEADMVRAQIEIFYQRLVGQAAAAVTTTP